MSVWMANVILGFVSTGISSDSELNAAPQDRETRECSTKCYNIYLAILFDNFCEVNSMLCF
jgi:hypothetical protein